MARKKVNRFTEEEIELIANAKTNGELKLLATKMDHSYDAIRKKKYLMDPANRRKYNKHMREYQRGVNANKGPNCKYPWSKAEIEFLKLSKATDVEIAEKLGRSVNAVHCKRRSLMEENKRGSGKRSKGNAEEI